MVIRWRPRLALNFATKVFLGLLGLSLFCVVLVGGSFFYFAASEKEAEYIGRYHLLGGMAANAFQQMEQMSEQINNNAARVLFEIERKSGLPSDTELLALIQQLGVVSLDITDRNGMFIRSPVNPMELQTNSLFDYCEDYQSLIDGTTNIQTTTILPSHPVGAPWKFTMIPNHDRTRVLESCISLEYINNILRETVKSDPNIEGLGLYSPNGKLLGSMHVQPSTSGVKSQSFLDLVGVGHSRAERSMLFGFKVPSHIKRCCECETKGVAATPGEDYAYSLRMAVSTDPLREQVATLRHRMEVIALVAVALGLVLAHLLSKQLVRRVIGISNTARAIASSGDLVLRVEHDQSVDEVSILAQSFNSMLNVLAKSREKLLEAERDRSVARVATQVAHDIRSPLAALNVALGDLAKPSEETRTLVRSAIFRIQDIANHLLYRNRNADSEECEHLASKGPILLSSFCEVLISEKRTQHRGRLGVSIEVGDASTSYGVFVEQPVGLLKRVLSNLIDNAVEALADSGAVKLSVKSERDDAVISISDDGSGMSPELLERLGKAAVTSGKDAGNGIGFLWCHQRVASWGGRVDVESTVGSGTTVRIRLPKAAPPLWFLARIDLAGIATVVILDDDVSIHRIWTDRLAPFGRLKVIHLSTAAGLRQSSALGAQDTLFLMDYELLGSTTTGLDLIEELGLADRAVLVTSRFEEDALVHRCLTRGVSLLPKPVAAYVPLVEAGSTSRGTVDAVLVDDDPMVRRMWQNAAARAEKVLVALSDAKTLLDGSASVPTSVPIYIDSNLGPDVRGQDVAQVLFTRGFKSLVLTTGYEPSMFGPMPWIASIQGKLPPF
jgi:signal transduction histidine kinase